MNNEEKAKSFLTKDNDGMTVDEEVEAAQVLGELIAEGADFDE